MKKGLLLFCCILFLFSSCAGEAQQQPAAFVGQQTVLYTEIKGRVSEKAVSRLEDASATLDAFCSELHIAHYKTFEEGSYIVLKTSRGLFLVVFDENGVYESRREITFSKNDGAGFFDALRIGKTTLDDVRAAEPDGQYDYLEAGWTEFPRYSFHFFRNGEACRLWFENDVLTEILRFTI